MGARIAAALGGAAFVAVSLVGLQHVAVGGSIERTYPPASSPSGDVGELSRGFGSMALAEVLPTVPTDTPTPTHGPHVPVVRQGAERGSLTEAWQRFSDGYAAYQGEPAWLAHFVNVVLPCESSEWGGWYSNGYVSRAQFSPGSWATAVQHTALADPTDPYHVGANVAYWSGAIDHPGSSAGWPTCWWQ